MVNAQCSHVTNDRHIEAHTKWYLRLARKMGHLVGLQNE